MDLSRINAAAAKTFLPTKKVMDLEVGEVYTVSAIREVKTRFGTKVVVEVEEEFQFFLPNHLQLYFEKEPDQLATLKVQVDNNNISLEYLGDRKLKFITRRKNLYYAELGQY